MRGRSALLRRGVEEFIGAEPVLAQAQGAPVETGDAWTASQLRLKSYADLHKLWFVLLKEKNKLLTERHRARALNLRMASPERLHKVKLSMARLKTVVGERSLQHKSKLMAERRKELIDMAIKHQEEQAIFHRKRKLRNEHRQSVNN